MSSTTKHTNGPPVPPKQSSSSNVKYYLIAYNAVSAVGWAIVLVYTLTHLFGWSSTQAPPVSKPADPSYLATLLSYWPSTRTTTTTTPSKLSAYLSTNPLLAPLLPFLKPLLPLFVRAKTTYGSVATVVQIVQSAAILEVVHVLLGWVKSPLATAAMQVASRIWLVWGIAFLFPETHTNPLYTTMVLAWSLTEVPRYTYYTLSLLASLPPSPPPSTQRKPQTSPLRLILYKLYTSAVSSPSFPTTSSFTPPHWLTYLRYTTFWVLYPLGAGSEAFLMGSTTPLGRNGWKTAGGRYWSSAKGGVTQALVRNFSGWTGAEYARGVLFVLWWPGLYVMYTYMMHQRRKVLGKSKSLASAEARKRKVKAA